MQKSIQISRINWIDWAKTFGIFLVILGHVNYPPEVMYLKKLIYGFHMPFFFLISGILYKEEKDCIIKNIYRLIIPYFAFNILFLLCSFMFNLRNGIDFDSNKVYITVFLDIFKGKGIEFVPSWFLFTLFWAKIFTYYLLKLKPILILIISILVGIIGFFINGTVCGSFYCLALGLLATPFVVIGYLCKKYNLMETIFQPKTILFISCIFLFIFYLFLAYKLKRFDFALGFLTNKPLWGVMMSLIGSYVFIFFCRLLNHYSNRFVKTVSTGTLFILMFHFKIYIYYLTLYSSQPNFFISFLFCLGILLFSYYMILMLLKSKILSLLFLGKLSI